MGKLFEKVRDAIVVADAKTQRIVLWNPAATQLFGYSTSEALEMQVEALVPEGLKGQHRMGMARYNETGRGPYIDSHRPLELPALRKSGEEITIELSLSPIESVDRVYSGYGRFVLALIRDVTERKRAKEETKQLNKDLEKRITQRTAQLEAVVADLKDSEERFRLLVEGVKDYAIFMLDPEGRVASWNEGAHHINGYRESEIFGRHFSVFYPTEDIERGKPEHELEVAKAEGAYEEEGLQVRKDGSRFWASILITALRDEKGRLRGFSYVTRDVTEYRRAQEALRQSEERLRSLVQNVSDIITIIDTEGTVSYISPAVERVLGRRPEEILGTNIFDHIYPEDKDWALGVLAEARSTPHLLSPVEYNVPHKDGSLRSLESVVSNRLDDPVVRGIVVNSRDITERKQAEKRLRESEERHRAVVEQAAEGILLVDVETRHVLEANAAYQNLIGYASEEILGLTLYDLVPYSRENIDSYVQRVLERRSYVSGERRHRRKDGSLVDVEISSSLISYSGRRAICIVVRDITERKRAEKALRQSEDLYRSVVEQTEENIFLVDMKTKRILEANPALSRSLGYTGEELKQMTLYDIVAHDRESVDYNIERIMKEGRCFIGERAYRRKDGSLTDVEVNVCAVPYGGKKAMCVVAHDVAERRWSEDNLRRSLSVMLALREAGQILGSTLESEEIVSRLLEIMQSVLGLTATIISTQDENGLLRIWRSVGLEGLWRQARFAPEAESARRVASRNEKSSLFRLQPTDPEAGYLLGMCLPLRTRDDHVMGVLEVYGTDSLVESDTVQLLESLTNQAASALENARLYGELSERERRLQDLVGKLLGAQEEERRRVAYEVHDGLAQVAVAAHQRLQAFAQRYPPNTERSRRDLERVLKLGRRTVSDARKIIGYLRPTVLDDFGLGAAISSELEGFREEGYQIDYEEDLGDERLPDTVEIALFRIAQEALTNVRKHAQTRQVRVELRNLGHKVYLEVRDFGGGFDPNTIPGRSGPGERIGLAGMRERVGMFGGKLELYSRPSAGTSISVEIPLPSANSETPGATNPTRALPLDP